MNVCRVGNKASDFKLFSKDVTGIIFTREAVSTLILMVASAPPYIGGRQLWFDGMGRVGFRTTGRPKCKDMYFSLVIDCLLVPSSASSDSTVETAALKVSNFTAVTTFYRPGRTTFTVGPVRGRTTAKACATHTRRI